VARRRRLAATRRMKGGERFASCRGLDQVVQLWDRPAVRARMAWESAASSVTGRSGPATSFVDQRRDWMSVWRSSDADVVGVNGAHVVAQLRTLRCRSGGDSRDSAVRCRSKAVVGGDLFVISSGLRWLFVWSLCAIRMTHRLKMVEGPQAEWLGVGLGVIAT